MTDGVVGAIRGLFRGRGRAEETDRADRAEADLARVDAEITAFGEAPCEGEGAFTRTVVTPRKPGLLYVRSRGTWTLTPAGGPGKRAAG
ncbi:hypothetical protein [Streptomyces filamentosus]|uniref:hypothetical protein n=1 Tax=Streptomyces filamentosus TaxID=67294 RepID=UPI00123BC5F5|nr:hypothetical protein [Streptomyces filamentosus]